MDEYTSEDWKKFQAAVSVLKSPILGDSVELEPSPIGEYIHTESTRSRSTPNIFKISEPPFGIPGRASTGPDTYFIFPSPTSVDYSTPYAGKFPESAPLAAAHKRWRRKSEPSSTPILDTKLALNRIPSDERLAEWVAELPESSHGRTRALTGPSRGPVQRVKRHSDSEKGSELPLTLPRGLKLSDEVTPVNTGDKEESTVSTQTSPAKQPPQKEKRPSRQQSSSPVLSEASLGPSALVRLHMDTIQKGEL